MPKKSRTLLELARALCLAMLVATGVSAGSAVLIATSAHAQAVRDIRVVGNQRVTPETVRSYLQLAPGESFDAGKVDRSLKALFNTGLFSDVRIDRDGSTVVVTVVENPVVAQVAFEGNREIDVDTLRGEVQLRPRQVYTRARALSDVQRILDIYRRRGLYAASVEPKLIELDQNRVNVVFEINEGKTTKVNSISFIGNRAFTDGQLRDIISTNQSGWFDFLKTNTVYDPDRLSLDRELLRQYYLKNGYADMRVVSANAELDRAGSGFIITFSIDEGELYRFGDVKIEARLPNLSTDRLRGEISTSAGAYFNASDLEKSVERLTLVVSEMGFPFVRVRPDVDRVAAARVVNVTYVIEEGPRVYIERINITGNTRTKDHVIRREIRLAEGDAFNPAMVDRAKKRLQSLGFFKTVEIKRRPGFAQDRVILDVEVVEQPTGELSFGAGYSTSEGIIGDIGFTERNLFGNGQFLRLKIGGSTTRRQVDLSFTEPRFLDRNLAAGFDLFFKDLNQTSTSSYKSRKEGGSVRLGFPLSENLWLNTAYTLSRDDIYYVDTQTASLAIRLAGAGGKLSCESNPSGPGCKNAGEAWTSAAGLSLTYDTRNHPRNPNRGFFFSVGPEFAGLGGDVQYIRVQAEGRAYYPIYDKVTLVGRVIGGHIEGWGGDDVRLLDMFYKGGETVRGFFRSGIGPRDTNTRDALGGQNFWAATAEVRFPLPLLPEELGISGAIFADAGSVWGASTQLTNNKDIVVQRAPSSGVCANASRSFVCLADDNSVRASVGASIMWQSPVGPLRLDYANVLNREKYDRTQQIRFGASTQF